MRKLSAAAQQERRRQVIGLRQAGMTYEAIAGRVGLSATGVLNICHRYAERGAAGLKSGPREPEPGYGRFLSAAQEADTQRLIRRHTPDELDLPFALWSRAAVRELIRQRFGVRLAVRTVGTYLARWGFTAQKPLRRAYEQDPAVGLLPKIRPHGAIVYDQRILSWKGPDRVSILTLGGREVMPWVAGAYQQARLAFPRGQADLVYRDGQFFLFVTVDVGDVPPGDPEGFLGVDLGRKNIAVDSDGDGFSGAHIANLRNRHARLRTKLQKKGTQSAKRLLRQRRAKERRFAADVNHRISKALVRKAKDTGRGIAFEDLKGIRERTTVRKAERRAHHSWAFAQLRSFV
ncbi:winged helix-turn-helix domain-containing protein, partial [Paracraurococcus lichenis]